MTTSTPVLEKTFHIEGREVEYTGSIIAGLLVYKTVTECTPDNPNGDEETSILYFVDDRTGKVVGEISVTADMNTLHGAQVPVYVEVGHIKTYSEGRHNSGA